MALLFKDGFDYYVWASGGNTDQLLDKWDGQSSSYSDYHGLTSSNVRTGTQCYRGDIPSISAGRHTCIYKNLSGNPQTVIVGMAMRMTDTNSVLLLDLRDDSTKQIELHINSGYIEVYRDTAKLAEYTDEQLVVDTWYYIELKAKIDNSVGTVDVQLDGELVISATGLDTQQSPNSYCNRVYIFSPNPDYAYNVNVDDVYICDTSGAQNNDFLGNVAVEAIYPNGDTATIDWTPQGAGSHYVEVDDPTPDDSATYVETGTVTNEDLYDFSYLGTIVGDVFAVRGYWRGIKTGPLIRKITPKVKSGTTTDADTERALTQAWTYISGEIHEVDPDTGVAWTVSGVNAVQAGQELTT